MVTYAILGATGQTGSAILSCLAARPVSDLTLHLFVRSTKKLLSAHPYVGSRSNVVVFEGTVNDSKVLAKCLHGADIIFSCIAINESFPGQGIALDAAKAVVSALRIIQRDSGPQDYRPPTVVVLSSASMNPVFSAGVPFVLKYILTTALSYEYEDLRRAEAFYTSLASDHLFNIIFAQPSAIMPGEVATGYELSTTHTSSVVSYADLGAGMVEMGERGGEFIGKGVTVVATGEVKQDWGPNLRALTGGLWAHVYPGTWFGGGTRE